MYMYIYTYMYMYMCMQTCFVHVYVHVHMERTRGGWGEVTFDRCVSVVQGRGQKGDRVSKIAKSSCDTCERHLRMATVVRAVAVVHQWGFYVNYQILLLR